MGKIKVKGKAEKGFLADRCEIDLTIQVIKRTASAASKAMDAQVEKLLGKLIQMGIEPEQIEITWDVISEQSSRESKDVDYVSRRSLSFIIAADIKSINDLRDIIENGFENVTFSTHYSVHNEIELQYQLLQEAVADSKKKAETIAVCTGQTLQGIDAINLADDDWLDLTDEEEFCKLIRHKRESCLSDRLKPEAINLTQEVTIIWLLE